MFEGYDTSDKMTEAFGFVNRQSSYYRHAAQLIGLVTMDRNKYKLTESGEEFLKLPQEKKSSYVCKLLLEFKIINRIFLEISVDKSKIISRNDIIQILRQCSNITGSTLGRRAQTIISWFRWMLLSPVRLNIYCQTDEPTLTFLYFLHRSKELKSISGERWMVHVKKNLSNIIAIVTSIVTSGCVCIRY